MFFNSVRCWYWSVTSHENPVIATNCEAARFIHIHIAGSVLSLAHRGQAHYNRCVFMTSVRATKIGIPTLREKAKQRKKNVAKEM